MFYRGKLDFVLVPLRLALSAYASLNIIIKWIKLFSVKIWEYEMPAITATLFTFGSEAKDFKRPSFQTVDVNHPDKALSEWN